MARFINSDFLFGGRTITGSDRRDVLFGRFGDDVIEAGGGNDVVIAGFGDDTVTGGLGSDVLFGGRGTDTAIFAGGVQDYDVSGGARRAVVTEVADPSQVDRLYGIERLVFQADGYTADLTGANNAVLARDDVEAVGTGETVLSGLVANDFDFDGDTLSIVGLDETGLRGSATLNPDGTVSFDAGDAFDALAEGETAETSFSYTVADGRGSTATASVTLTVTGMNDAPVLTLPATASVTENGTDVVTALASDVDAGDSLSFSLGGADAARFEIGPDGALRFAQTPDFEAPADLGEDNVYDVTVTVTDAGGLSDSRDLQVTVTDEDEAPALRINEFHYDNAGADTGEFIEVAGAPGTDLTGWSLVLYNGSNGTSYGTIALTGSLDDAGFASVDAPGLQNGGPDGIALVDPTGAVAEFLSYEGSFTADGGPADGLASTDIGVAESGSTAAGQSLQLGDDGVWTGPLAATRDAANDGGDGDDDGGGDGGGEPPVVESLALSEFHYDNAGGDEGEFVEVAGAAGGGLTGWSIVLYNGNGGGAYDTIALSGALNAEGFASVDAPGIQNGADAIALVDPSGAVVEFIAYEDDVTATDGPAAGLTATDIGVAETSGTEVGQSLQKQVDGSWAGPFEATRGAANDDGSGGGDGGDGPGPSLLISQVQGTGGASAFEGQVVNVTGVVTATLGDGFYLQEEDADSDGDAATSEGLFVLTGGAPDVTVGEVVYAQGSVAEEFGLTRIEGGTLDRLGTAALPTAAAVTLPIAASFDFETVEGMRVTADSAPDAEPLTIIETFNFDRFGELVLSAGEQIQPTQILDAQTQAAEIAALQEANAANRLRIDDGSSEGNPTSFAYIANDTAGDDGDGILSAGDDFGPDNPAPRIGAELSGPVEGVVTFSFGEYRIIPTTPLPVDPATNAGDREIEAPEVGGELTVVSFNALNYFTTLNERGATTPFDLARQTEKLVNALVELDGDVVGLQEVENNGFGEGSAIVALADAVNARLGSEVYGVVDPTEDGGPIGTDAITNGLLYKLDSVSVLGSGILEFDDGGQQRNRPAVAAAFEDEDGAVVTIAVNHFKSKGPSGLDAGDPTNPDSDQGDGQGFWNATRTDAAEQLTAWLATDPFETGDPDTLVIGDVNAYSQEDPVQAIEAAGYDNLLEEFIGAEDAFSFVFNGQRGALDQALSTEGLTGQVTGVAEWHINSLEPDLLSYSSEFADAGFYDGDDPFAASDHDPLLIGLTLTVDDTLFA